MLDLFAIPQALDRRGQPVKTQRKYRKKTKLSKSPFSKQPPKSKRWAGAERVTVHLSNECNKLGCGQRIVWAKAGRKWVLLCDLQGNRGRLALQTFNKVRVQ